MNVELTETQKDIAEFILKNCTDGELVCIMFCSYRGLIMAKDEDFFLENGESTCDIRCSLQAFEPHFKGLQGKLKIWIDDVVK